MSENTDNRHHEVLVWGPASHGDRTASGRTVKAGWVWSCTCGAWDDGYSSEDAAEYAADVDYHASPNKVPVQHANLGERYTGPAGTGPAPSPLDRMKRWAAQVERERNEARAALARIEAICNRNAEAKAQCAAQYANGEDCGCAFKDCYECGLWHNCTHDAFGEVRAALATPAEARP